MVFVWFAGLRSRPGVTCCSGHKNPRSALNWQQNTIAEGDFTVEKDRAVVVKLGEVAVESKIEHLWLDGRTYGAAGGAGLCMGRSKKSTDGHRWPLVAFLKRGRTESERCQTIAWPFTTPKVMNYMN